MERSRTLAQATTSYCSCAVRFRTHKCNPIASDKPEGLLQLDLWDVLPSRAHLS